VIAVTMSSSKASTAERPKTRPPAPALFVGPPSRNASSQSLALHKDRPTSSRAGLSRQKSLLGEHPRLDTRIDNVLSPADAGISSPFTRRPNQDRLQTQRQTNERTEAKWVEMQNTLEELELSATTGIHVFGADHSKALEELRTAQIALAQAWARGDGEEEGFDATQELKAADETQVTADVLSSDKPGAQVKSRERSGTNTTGKSQLEEETENDIEMARKRREANDRYFRKVNAGVKDVVAKLEEVAKAMKGVEKESNEIWNDRDSLETSSIS
jgi:hypothetical protein